MKFEHSNVLSTEAVRPTDPIKVFFSYSRRDEALKERLEKHLMALKRRKVITTWHDRRIDAGEDWAGQIDKHLDSAQIILLLISPDFLASDYCYDVEMARAQKRAEAGEARVIPVILRPGDYEGVPFTKYRGLPPGMKPVTRWSNQDEAFKSVAEGVRAAVDELIEKETRKVDKTLSQLFTMMQRHNADYERANKLVHDKVEAQKTQMARWKILQDTLTQIYRIQQEVTANKAQTQDAAYKKWDQYIRA
jgi:hypothetical protein